MALKEVKLQSFLKGGDSEVFKYQKRPYHQSTGHQLTKLCWPCSRLGVWSSTMGFRSAFPTVLMNHDDQQPKNDAESPFFGGTCDYPQIFKKLARSHEAMLFSYHLAVWGPQQPHPGHRKAIRIGKSRSLHLHLAGAASKMKLRMNFLP